jgi:hypothetical protein
VTHYNLEKLAYQRQLMGAGIGALGGGALGYIGATRGRNESEDAFSSRRVGNAMIGATLGGALGAGVGHYTGRRAAPAAAPAAAPHPPAAAPAAAPSQSVAPPPAVVATAAPPHVDAGAPPAHTPELVGTQVGVVHPPAASGGQAAVGQQTSVAADVSPPAGTGRAPATPPQAAPTERRLRLKTEAERGVDAAPMETHDVSGYNWPQEVRVVTQDDLDVLHDLWARETLGVADFAAAKEHLKRQGVHLRDVQLGYAVLNDRHLSNPYHAIHSMYNITPGQYHDERIYRLKQRR